jgi:hypothetical protein
LGAAWLEQGRGWGKTAARLATAALFAANICWFQLPARDAWSDADDIENAHRALAALEPGPVVEIPWRIHRISTATNGSRYMIASSLHWNPMLNGYTAYVPPTYHFVQRLAQSLPDRHAVENLRRLTGLRWIVLHPERLGRKQRRLWSLAERAGELRIAVAKPDFRIYEVPAAPGSGSWRAALLAEEPGPTTMTGLPRAPLAAPARPGRLRVTLRDTMRYEHGSGLPYFATVALVNPSDEPWPGFDFQTEGLVQLRYRFFDANGEMVREATAPLDKDFPPQRETVTQALVRPPAADGRYRVRFDVVQRLGDELRELGLPAVESAVEVSERPLLPGARPAPE